MLLKINNNCMVNGICPYRQLIGIWGGGGNILPKISKITRSMTMKFLKDVGYKEAQN